MLTTSVYFATIKASEKQKPQNGGNTMKQTVNFSMFCDAFSIRKENYYGKDYETIEDVENHTTVIRIDDDSFIVADF